MGTFKFSFQHPDFESDEDVTIAADQIADALKALPWDAELKRFEAMLAEKRDACPPGAYINNDDGVLVSICRNAADEFVAYLRFPRRRKILGLFPADKEFHRTGRDLAALLPLPEAFVSMSTDQFFDDLQAGRL